MQVTREDLNPCTIKLTIVCEPDEVTAGFDKAIKKFGKKARIPGFRPGLAPKHLVEQAIIPEELYREAADEIVRVTFKKALTEEKIEPHDRPSVTLSSLDREKGQCEYFAKVPLAPQVELGDYRSISVERPKVEVTDEEVEQHIEDLRRRQGKREAVTDRGVQESDVTVVNIKPDGEEGEGRTFMTIAGQTFGDLDEAIKGMRVEEMKSVDLSFPDSFQEKDWAGKKLHCKITLRSLSSVKLPELDDDFAKALSGDQVAEKLKSKDLDELKKKMRELIGAAKMAMAQDTVNEHLQEELLKISKIEVPDTMWENVASQRLNDLAGEVRQRGQSIEDYAKEQGMTVEKMVEEWQSEAKLHVKRAVAIRDIFVKEKLGMTNQDLNEALFDMAREYEMKPEDLLPVLRKNNMMHEVEFRAIFRKVIGFLNQHAKTVNA